MRHHDIDPLATPIDPPYERSEPTPAETISPLLRQVEELRSNNSLVLAWDRGYVAALNDLKANREPTHNPYAFAGNPAQPAAKTAA